MKEFQVPQFITVEDQIIGPLTFKQAIFILGGGIIIIIAYYIFVPFLFFIIAIVVAILAGMFAFLKINDIPFPQVAKNGFFYLMKPHIYIWKKQDAGKPAIGKPAPTSQITVNQTPTLSESKITDLAWSLNITEKIRQSEEEKQKTQAPF